MRGDRGGVWLRTRVARAVGNATSAALPHDFRKSRLFMTVSACYCSAFLAVGNDIQRGARGARREWHMTQRESNQSSVDRRDFFKVAGAGFAAAAFTWTEKDKLARLASCSWP